MSKTENREINPASLEKCWVIMGDEFRCLRNYIAAFGDLVHELYVKLYPCLKSEEIVKSEILESVSIDPNSPQGEEMNKLYLEIVNSRNGLNRIATEVEHMIANVDLMEVHIEEECLDKCEKSEKTS